MYDGFTQTMVKSVEYDKNTRLHPYGDFPNALTTIPDGDYLICTQTDQFYLDAEKNSKVQFSIGGQGCVDMWFDGKFGNPPIVFDYSRNHDGTQNKPNRMISLTRHAGYVAPFMDEYYGGLGKIPETQELILTKDLFTREYQCRLFGEVGDPVDPVFAEYMGQLWIHDPRFRFSDNTMESPLADGGGLEVEATEVSQGRYFSGSETSSASFN